MNADFLLEHFNRISDAPDAIPSLRQFILDLAVRGKFVEQQPHDEPSPQLFQRIQSEKTRLAAIGESKVQTLEPIAASDIPFRIPPSWTWVRLGDICSKTGSGSTPRGGKSVYQDLGVPFLRSQNIYDDGVRLDDVAYISRETHGKMAGTAVRPDDLLLNITGGSIGRCCLVPSGFGDANVSQHVAIIRPAISGIQAYLHRLILSPYFQSFVFSEQTGAGRGGLPKNRMDRIPVALPPLAVQCRIVARVNELMALCDQLEATQSERGYRRDRLVTASLQRLTGGADPSAFREQAQFYLSKVPTLTTRADHIEQIRRTILNLAVRGYLVAQEPNDEPSAELFKRAKAEINASTRKKSAPLPPIDHDVAPFQLPKGWIWARFSELGVFGRGKSKHRPRNDRSLFEGGTHPLVQTGDVARSNGVIETYTSKYNDVGLAQSFKWPRGALCITIAANIADSGILSFDACFPDSVVGFVPASVFPTAKYFEYFVRTAKANLLEFAPATAQKNINLEILNNVLIPLPPLAEHNRIVAKVDELMLLCDRLEEQLAISQAESRRLLDAVLHEALNSVNIERAA